MGETSGMGALNIIHGNNLLLKGEDILRQGSRIRQILHLVLSESLNCLNLSFV